MKLFRIAVKDLVRSFRSSFLIGMMFVAPVLITAIIYFAFGSMVSGEGALKIPSIRAQVVNLDQPDPALGVDTGKRLVEFLQSEGLTAILQTSPSSSEAEARAAVDRRAADVAIIIPGNLSAAVSQPNARASVVVYSDPTQTLGPTIVKMLLNDFLDGFSGAKIAVEVTGQQMSARGLGLSDAQAQAVAQQYAGWVQAAEQGQGDAGSTLVALRVPQANARPINPITGFLGPVMAGMMCLFVFFTGSAAAQSILQEDEEGTLARLFTTPTSHATILGGKFVAVFLTLVVQIAVLLVISSLLFGIQWGDLLTMALLTLGTSAAASGFGILLNSLIKTTRQAGPIGAGVVVVTGILSGLVPTGDPSQPSPFDTIGLAFPQGWALHGWKLSLSGASAGDIVLPLVVLLIAGAALFTIGTLIFRRRCE